MLLVIILIVGLIFTGAIGYGAYYYRSKLVQLRSVELSDIKDLEEGVGKVTGEVVAEEDPIKSPVSGTACVFYQLEIEEEQIRQVPYEERRGNTTVRGTRTEKSWVSILHEVRYVSFEVRDDTGEASVEMEKAHVVISKKSRVLSGTVRQLPDKAFGRLCRLYPTIERTLERKKCRYTETTILEDDKLLVMGNVEFMKNDKPLIAYAKKKPFIVSDKSDAQLQRHFKNYFVGFAIGTAVALVGTIVGVILAAK